MDMKKILQAMDGVSTTPVQGASDMAKFVSIVTEGKDTKTNRLSTAEQMITQGYTTMSTVPTLNKKPAKESVIGKYFDEVLAESVEVAEAKKEKTKAVAKKIADKLKKKSVEEGHYRRPGSSHAYDKDVRASQSGMGHKDSLAYQQDGGANDEGWDKEPYQHKDDKPVLKGYYFYNVPAGMEGEAAIYGVKKTKNGKWAKALYSTSGRSYALQKNGADKAFGPGKFWAPKNKGTAEGSLSELSKDTLSNYADKADMDIVKKHRNRTGQDQAGNKSAVAKTDKHIDKRMKGIDSANSRLNKGVGEDSESDPLKNREEFAKKHNTPGKVYKKGYDGDKVGMSKSYAYDIKRTGPKGHLPEQSVVEGDEKPFVIGRK